MPRFSRCHSPGRGLRRAGFSTIWIMLIVISLLVAGGALAWVSQTVGTTTSDSLTQTAFRAEFVHDVTERGEIESANNVEIRCQVKANGKAGTPILTIVPEGTYVEKGDLVVQLDSSALENEHTSQIILANKSKATMIQSKNAWDAAKISKIEYEEGTYQQERQTIQSEIFVAEEDLRRAEQYLQYSEQLANKGYVTALQLEADRFAVDKAKNDLDSAQQRLKVLEKYTQQKQLTTLEAEILTAEARYLADKNTYELDLRQADELKLEVEKCTLLAPSGGQVVYANEYDRRGGSEVVIEEGAIMRQGQVMVRLPDPAKMQVKTKITEARIGFVTIGMPVVIRIDAFPELALTGRVTRVSEYPEPGGWMSSNVKEYATWIAIDQADKRLRPGLTAEVKIEVRRIEDELQIAVQAIQEHGGDHYVFVSRPNNKWEPRQVQLGPSNNKFVVIESGLEAGVPVAANPRAHLKEVELPEIPASQRDLKQRRSADPDAELQPPPMADRDEETTSPTDPPVADKPTADGEQPAAGGRPNPRQMMARHDTDGDGALSADELSNVPERFRGRLLEFDANGDGALDADELRAAAAARSGGGDAE